MRRAALLVAAICLVSAGAGVCAAPVLAHAQLQTVTPQRGAVLAAAPRAVVFVFDEPVSGPAGAVRVYGPRGARADDGAAFHPRGDQRAFGVALKSRLPRGTYTSTYQVISADGHVVGGGSTFSIGAPSATSGTVGQLLARQKAGPVTRDALTVARGVQYLAIAVGVGTIVFLLLIWPPAFRRAGGGGSAWDDAERAFRSRTRMLLLASAATGALSAALAVALEAADASGEGLFALSGSALSAAIDARFGTVWGIAVLAWLALGAAAAIGPRAGHAGAVALAVPAAALVLVPGLGGHAGAIAPTAILIPANALHVIAASVWVGGIVCLLSAVRAATARVEGPARALLLVEVTSRFSAFALGAVVLLAASGVVQALELISGLGDLTDTGYGRLILIKSALLLVLAGLGALQRRRTLPGLRAAARDERAPGNAGRLLRRTLRVEAGLLVLVFVATAVLAGSSPSGQATGGPIAFQTRIGPAQLEGDVDPGRVGANAVHLYLLDPRTGAPWDRASEVDLSIRQPKLGIGPLKQRATKSGPGHYTAAGVQFGAPGTWRMLVTVRAGEFDEYLRTLTVKIR